MPFLPPNQQRQSTEGTEETDTDTAKKEQITRLSITYSQNAQPADKEQHE